MLKKLNNYFQRLGKAFMLPIALISFAGIFLGISAAFSNPNVIAKMPFLGNSTLQMIFQFTKAVTGALFGNLPVLFAISLAIGLAKDETAVAGFSGFVGYIILNVTINFVLTATKTLAPAAKMTELGQGMTLGIQTLQLGVFGGIIVGMVTGALHNRFYTIKLPDYIGFFGGTRFVPIVTTFVFSLLGLFVPVVWPPISAAIQGLGYAIANLGYFGTFLFGLLERLLIPFGLHHILNAMFRFTPVGGEMVIGGKTIAGALNIYYAQLGAGVSSFSTEATRFLAQGKIPIMMFGLPGAALAMYRTAKPENKQRIKGVLMAGALASFVTGITEPLEFSFLFVAPVLYIIHSVLSGLSFMLNHVLGVAIGNTQGGVIDLVVFGMLQENTKWYITLAIGIIYAFVYYFVFKFVIEKMNLKTPGREEDVAFEDSVGLEADDLDAKALEIIRLLGGKSNIESVNNCFTRLRVVVKDMSLVDEKGFAKTGAAGVIKPSKTDIQIIYGPSVSSIKVAVTKQLKKIA
ncbi:PTS transporter subunit EIIC [Fonticella tunisiensis]|uniref:PTS system IIB component (Glc family) /PTS system IIC component (Glc family) n=1 Tax=Fonticella tunisiensis TaxID=1096341 RepID=A0A4R7KBF0_9CLOT|nr:PTS transporter subunit EIIC [Fonticella tunisiensis]TDT51967.1 PTS system IIB component (Glc family) /PTS system IIC component (Glc family) [Fonticella tunisiensis]